jgi:RND family efflux transporter MFP subunit
MNKKTAVKILVPVIVIVAAIVVWLSMTRTRVVVERATRGTAVSAVTGTVKVFANLDIRVKVEREGRVAEAKVKMGDMVKTGDVIMALDARTLNNEIEEKQVQLKAAKERLKLPISQAQDVKDIETDIARIEKQVEYGAASKADLERRKGDLTKIQTEYTMQKISREEQAGLYETSIKKLQTQIDSMAIKAPIDGKVVEQYVFPGDYIWVGNQTMRIVSPGRWVELTLAEEDSAYVENGQKANVHLASYPDRTFKATVTGLSSFSNPDNKTRTVFMVVDAPDDTLVPGLTGEAVLIKAEHKNAIIIPRRALIGNRVYIVKGGRIDIRKVTPGFLGLDQAEIVSGLEVGEEVVMENQSELRSGDLVKAVHDKDSD